MKNIIICVSFLMIITACDSDDGSYINPNQGSINATNYGSYTDQRDGQTYKTVKIGEQFWLAENMKYKPNVSYCYSNFPEYCDIYGRLYDWNAAMEACPTGWHLPTDEEWTQLIDHLGDEAGTKMKTTAGWEEDGNGTNESGFTAHPGGYRYFNSYFYSLGYNGHWWSASEYSATIAWERDLYYNNANVTRSYTNKNSGLSVRCVRD